MVKDKICEINVEKLMGEYHTLNNDNNQNLDHNNYFPFFILK